MSFIRVTVFFAQITQRKYSELFFQQLILNKHVQITDMHCCTPSRTSSATRSLPIKLCNFSFSAWLNVADETCESKDLVFQFLPSSRISIQSWSKSLTTLPQLPHLLVSLGDRPQDKVWKLLKLVNRFVRPIRESARNIFERDFACRKSKL